MTSITCAAAVVLAILTVPFLLIWRATETQPDRILRLWRKGMSERLIAERLSITRYRVQQTLKPYKLAAA